MSESPLLRVGVCILTTGRPHSLAELVENLRDLPLQSVLIVDGSLVRHLQSELLPENFCYEHLPIATGHAMSNSWFNQLENYWARLEVALSRIGSERGGECDVVWMLADDQRLTLAGLEEARYQFQACPNMVAMYPLSQARDWTGRTRTISARSRRALRSPTLSRRLAGAINNHLEFYYAPMRRSIWLQTFRGVGRAGLSPVTGGELLSQLIPVLYGPCHPFISDPLRRVHLHASEGRHSVYPPKSECPGLGLDRIPTALRVSLDPLVFNLTSGRRRFVFAMAVLDWQKISFRTWIRKPLLLSRPFCRAPLLAFIALVYIVIFKGLLVVTQSVRSILLKRP